MHTEPITKYRFHSFDRVHLCLFLAFYLVFAWITWSALQYGTDSDRRERPTVAATLGAVTGPFTGAIARRFQSCCWQNSLSIFPYSASILALAALYQIVPLPSHPFQRTIRLAVWCIGLLGWFGGALPSFAHALA